MSIIIGILGEKLAGKDSVAEYLIKTRGADHIKASHILDELLQVLGLPVTRRNEIDAGRGMETVFGPHIIGEAIKRRVQESKGDKIVINGLRLKDQFEDARKLGAKIIYITAPVELRYERFKQRRQKKEDGQQTIEEFIAQDKEWTEVGIPVLGTLADYKIENTGSLEELYKKVDDILASFK